MSLSRDQKAFTDADTQAAFGAAKGSKFESTYARLFKKFTRDINRVSDLVPDSNPQFVHMTREDVKSTHTNNRIRSAIVLSNLSTDVQTNLDHLKQIGEVKNNKLAKQMYDSYFQKFAPWKNDVDQRGNQRRELQQELGEYIKTMRTTFSEIAQAIKDNKPPAEIEAMFAKIEKKQQELDTKITSLNKNEVMLELNLKILLKQTHETLTAFASTGVISTEQLKQLKS